MEFNFLEEVKDLAETIKACGGLSGLNKQANLVLDLIEDKEVMNQFSIDYIKENYDISNGYCVCENEDSLIARLFGIQLAHGVSITTCNNMTEQEIIDTCVEVAEAYFNATRVSQMSYSLKEYALNTEPYATKLSESVRRSKFVVEEINEDVEFKHQWGVYESIEEADNLINAMLKSRNLKRFRITQICYEGDKEVSSETVKEVTI